MTGKDGYCSLSELCDAIVDCEHKTAPTQEFGVPSIRTTNIKNGRIDFDNANRVSEETYKQWTVRREPTPGDLILAREAPVGEVAIIPPNQRVCLGQRTVLISPNRDKVDPRYLCHFLVTPEMRHRMICRAEGSTVPHLNMSDIRGLQIPPLPPLSEQKAIAHILGTLDDKIELNRRMNETLEGIARAIFKSWFVDFDPVRAKMDGRQPVAMDADTANLFPDEFEESELGPIPKGWKVGRVGNEFKLTMGQSPPGSTYNEVGEGLPFFQGRRDFGFRFPTRRVYCTAPTRLAEAGDTLVSVRAPVGDLNMAIDRCCIGRGVSAIRHRTGFRAYTYYAMQSLAEDFARYEAEGTVFGSISKKNFELLEVLVPLDSSVQAFEDVAGPLDEKIQVNTQELTQLATIRDTLLPKLLSGAIRVPEAEKEIEEVL